jgi:hypothetical protein
LYIYDWVMFLTGLTIVMAEAVVLLQDVIMYVHFGISNISLAKQ